MTTKTLTEDQRQVLGAVAARNVVDVENVRRGYIPATDRSDEVAVDRQSTALDELLAAGLVWQASHTVRLTVAGRSVVEPERPGWPLWMRAAFWDLGEPSSQHKVVSVVDGADGRWTAAVGTGSHRREVGRYETSEQAEALSTATVVEARQALADRWEQALADRYGPGSADLAAELREALLAMSVTVRLNGRTRSFDLRRSSDQPAAVRATSAAAAVPASAAPTPPASGAPAAVPAPRARPTPARSPRPGETP